MKRKSWKSLIPLMAIVLVAGIALLIMLHALNSKNIRTIVQKANYGHRVLQAAEELEFVQNTWQNALEQHLFSPSAIASFPGTAHQVRQWQALRSLHQLGTSQPIFQPYVDSLAIAANQFSQLADSATALYKKNGLAAARQYWTRQLEERKVLKPFQIFHQQQTAIHFHIKDVELSFLQEQNVTEKIRIYTLLLLAATLLAFFYALVRDAHTAYNLRKQYAFSRGILQHLPDAAATTDNRYHIRQWNKGFAALWAENQELEQADLRSLLPGWTPADTLELENTLKKKATWKKEWEHQDKEGNNLVLEISYSLLKRNNGQQVGGLWVLKDITQQRLQLQQLSRRAEKLELSLNQQVNFLQQVWNKIPEGIFQTDYEGRLLHVNRCASKLLTLPASSLEGKTIWEVFPVFMGTPLEAAFSKACRTGLEQDVEFNSPASKRLYKATLMPMGNLINVTFRDLSEVQLAQASVHSLSTELMQVREEERRRIARELHDELGQQLTGNKVMYTYLVNLLQLPPGQLKQQFDKLEQQMTDTLNKVRQLHRNFGHTQIEDLGLFDVLRQDAQSFSRTAGIELLMHNDVEELLLEPKTAVALYQIFAEALSNIGRHARATKAAVHITWEGDNLVMQISDNGVGFSAGQNHKPELGIAAMQERARLAGGTLNINSAPGQGTCIEVKVPL